LSLILGAIYCFYLIPVIIFLNWLQAFLEEKYLLEKRFGNEYRGYKKKVGMFLPKSPGISACEFDSLAEEPDHPLLPPGN